MILTIGLSYLCLICNNANNVVLMILKKVLIINAILITIYGMLGALMNVN